VQGHGADQLLATCQMFLKLSPIAAPEFTSPENRRWRAPLAGAGLVDGVGAMPFMAPRLRSVRHALRALSGLRESARSRMLGARPIDVGAHDNSVASRLADAARTASGDSP
jgi:hypothetical protein